MLYTPQVLALATSLARFPWDDSLLQQGSARSQSCGSSLALALSTDAEGRITQIGLRAHACAIGQAAAAIFAEAAMGHSRIELEASLEAISAWLANDGALPDWPGLGTIAAARAYPARHGAIKLAWKAALEALPSA